MTFARVKLALAALAFVAWLSWLAVTVWNKGTVQLVSTAQLTAATHLVVATVTTNDAGDAQPTVTVTKVLRAPAGEAVVGPIAVSKLDTAFTPLPVNDTRRIAAGEYLLPLIKTPAGYKIAGLPRSPGFEGADLDQPIVYPWTDDVKVQLRKYGILKE
ncbi:hypothetical protein [Limnoglobus roseus]|uniref:Uncharacterized protein n=1 Tax=Limnoglobus roseus TaxID=2598579 RepID=A0A5C1AGU3_9BACT|nr:hypothetical protein [Limnoglobus roseus]QEL16168.1 hypothetical protein PX52LOC_03108 [Limnoglobus roseus]